MILILFYILGVIKGIIICNTSSAFLLAAAI